MSPEGVKVLKREIVKDVGGVQVMSFGTMVGRAAESEERLKARRRDFGVNILPGSYGLELGDLFKERRRYILRIV